MYTLAITVVPSIIILLFFYFSDKFKEPKSTITTVFFLGILICLPAGILNGFMSDYFGDPKNQNDLNEVLKKIYESNFFKNVNLQVVNSILN